MNRRLIEAALLLLLAGGVPARAGEPPYLDILGPLAEEEGVPLSFLAAVMMAESGGNPYAVGDRGCSIGIFQLNACGGLGTGMGDRWTSSGTAPRPSTGST